MIAVRFATDTTRLTTLRLLTACLHDLGGVPGEVLTDRDPAFVVGSTPSGHAVFAPEWIDLAAVLALAPKACKPYRAKTKGKVERVIRELKEDFLPWLTGQVLPVRPSVADYDDLVLRWCTEVVGPRRHRTTKRIVAEAWADERSLLRPIPEWILSSVSGEGRAGIVPVLPQSSPVADHHLMAVSEDLPVKRAPESPAEPRWGTGWYREAGETGRAGRGLELRSAGESVEVPELADYGAVLR